MTKPIFFECTPDNLRRLINRLTAQDPEGWPDSSGERYKLKEMRQYRDEPIGTEVRPDPLGLGIELTNVITKRVDITPDGEAVWLVHKAGEELDRFMVNFLHTHSDQSLKFWELVDRFLEDHSGSACIKAYQERDNLVAVVPIDGLFIYRGSYNHLVEKSTKSLGTPLEELIQMITEEILASIKDDTGKSPGGRPRIAEDDWAYEQIKSGHDQSEVYDEWLERIPKKRRKDLIDPQDSFKHAISYRKRREKRE